MKNKKYMFIFISSTLIILIALLLYIKKAAFYKKTFIDYSNYSLTHLSLYSTKVLQDIESLSEKESNKHDDLLKLKDDYMHIFEQLSILHSITNLNLNGYSYDLMYDLSKLIQKTDNPKIKISDEDEESLYRIKKICTIIIESTDRNIYNNMSIESLNSYISTVYEKCKPYLNIQHHLIK